MKPALQNISVKELTQEEIPAALSLVWEVFSIYDAPDYNQDGVDEFYKSIHDDNYLAKLRIFGAFEEQTLIGVIATRNEDTHIALFFVDGKYHRKGVGTLLFQQVLKECKSSKMTVSSSPYAASIYHSFGFYDVDKEQVVNGLKFMPMELEIEQTEQIF